MKTSSRLGVDVRDVVVALPASASRSVRSSAARVRARDVKRLAEGHRSARRRACARNGARRAPSRSWPCDRERRQPLRRDHFAPPCPARADVPYSDVRELVAALGLVHVVRADEHRDALRARAGAARPRTRGARFGSTPAVGSSERAAARGSCSMHAASASRCFQPPESVPVKLVRRGWSSPRSVERLRRRARGGRASSYTRAMKSRFSRIVRSSQNEKRCVM